MFTNKLEEINYFEMDREKTFRNKEKIRTRQNKSSIYVRNQKMD